MEEIHQEMHLLSFTPPQNAAPPSSSHPPHPWSRVSSVRFDGPSLDLQLSISVAPLKPQYNSDNNCVLNIESYNDDEDDARICSIEAMKWQAAQQIRLAATERDYAERVMEMTRREMELAQSEFIRARYLRERAREDVGKAEEMKETAFRVSTGSMCMEITCFSCRQKFRP
ncbi:hypothetical protein OROHE_007813 [Orobanche hederae]